MHHGWISHMTTHHSNGNHHLCIDMMVHMEDLALVQHSTSNEKCALQLICLLFFCYIIVVVLQQSGRDDRQVCTQGLGITKMTQRWAWIWDWKAILCGCAWGDRGCLASCKEDKTYRDTRICVSVSWNSDAAGRTFWI
jgi:hypothetical protein